jgi:hypothetical protein
MAEVDGLKAKNTLLGQNYHCVVMHIRVGVRSK